MTLPAPLGCAACAIPSLHGDASALIAITFARSIWGLSRRWQSRASRPHHTSLVATFAVWLASALMEKWPAAPTDCRVGCADTAGIHLILRRRSFVFVPSPLKYSRPTEAVAGTTA